MQHCSLRNSDCWILTALVLLSKSARVALAFFPILCLAEGELSLCCLTWAHSGFGAVRD